MIKKQMKFLKALLKDEKGLTAVEYAVLGGIIVAAIGAASLSFEGNLEAAFDNMFSSSSSSSGGSTGGGG